MSMKVSVVLASFNGEKFIAEQIKTILQGLNIDDELIVSDDGSTDSTLNIINDFAVNDKRIKIVHGPMKGVVKNFENALTMTTGDLIFFADQDDIWCADKIKKVASRFAEDKNLLLLLHDMYICSDDQIENGEKGNLSFSIRRRKHGVLRNLVYNGYYGCCMAMSRKLLEMILPFPDNAIAYDQLIGVIAERYKGSAFLSEPLIIHRIHGDNMSKRLGLIGKIRFRIALWKAYRTVIKRNKRRLK